MPTPSTTTIPSTSLFPADPIPIGASLRVRERPPLRESIEITAPNGRRYRWADDEPRGEDRPQSDAWSDVMPGGYEVHNATLARQPGVEYPDLARLSKLTRFDASGSIIWQGRLERTPRVSGDEASIASAAVGYQAHLEDDKSVRTIYRDVDLTGWTGPSINRRVLLAAAAYGPSDPRIETNGSTGLPGLVLEIRGAWLIGSRANCEAAYDAGPGNRIGSVYVAWSDSVNVNHAGDANWSLIFYISSDADIASSVTSTADLAGTLPPAATTLIATTAARYAHLQFLYATGPAGADNSVFRISTRPIVYGDHGLTKRGTEPNAGFYDADIVRHAIARWCPLLTVTDESVTAGTFVVPQAAFRDPTTVAEIVRQITRFDLRSWAVWEGPVFWLHDRGARGQKWRARVGPTRLEETGPTVDRLWGSIVVAYQDVDGSMRTVGPPGSGADTEDARLVDTDPDNPANQLGITRRDVLVMGTSTYQGAIQIGARFLAETKLLNSSGRATIVGHVEDDHGVLHPYSHVHSGDRIAFVNAADTSYRHIVHTDKTRADRSCAMDLDAPPESLQALLERLGVVLVALGLG